MYVAMSIKKDHHTFCGGLANAQSAWITDGTLTEPME
jgi:hypothetical protein